MRDIWSRCASNCCLNCRGKRKEWLFFFSKRCLFDFCQQHLSFLSGFSLHSSSLSSWKWSKTCRSTNPKAARFAGLSLSHLINAIVEGLQIKCKRGCFHHWAAVEDVTAEENKIKNVKISSKIIDDTIDTKETLNWPCFISNLSFKKINSHNG